MHLLAPLDQRTLDLCLANCYFAHNSLRFPALLPFFNASSLRPFHPPNRRPDPVVPTWRRPFPRCRAPSSCRLDGALDPSYSSSPFRNRSETLDTPSPSQSHVQAKAPRAVLTEPPSEARSERTQRRPLPFGDRNEAT